LPGPRKQFLLHASKTQPRLFKTFKIENFKYFESNFFAAVVFVEQSFHMENPSLYNLSFKLHSNPEEKEEKGVLGKILVLENINASYHVITNYFICYINVCLAYTSISLSPYLSL
jgi:hypothetical protein